VKDTFPREFDDSKNKRQAQAMVWRLAGAYTRGYQDVYFNTATLNLRRTSRIRDGQRDRPVINLMLTKYRMATARMSVLMPGFAIHPASDSPEDVQKAMSSELALKWMWQKLRMARVFNELVSNGIVTGNAGLHSYYDEVYKCVKTEVIRPVDLFFQPEVKRPEDSAWIAVRKYIRRDELKEMYPEKAEKIEEAPATTANPEDGDRRFPEDVIEVCYVFFKDDNKTCVYLGKTKLASEKRKNGLMPVQFYRFTDLPDYLWGVGLMEPLISLQAQLNEMQNQVFRNVHLMANPKWLVSRNSGVNVKDLANKVGGIVAFNAAGGPPQQSQPQGLPQYVSEALGMTRQYMEDVSGIHGASIGRRTPGVSSGRAIMALSENDTALLQRAMDNLTDVMEDWSKTVLMLMAQHWGESRFVKAMDLSGRVISKTLKQTDLVEVPEVFIDADTLFQHTAQAREARLMSYAEMQIIDIPTLKRSLSDRIEPLNVGRRMRDIDHARNLLEAAKRVGEGLIGGIEVFTTDPIETIMDVFDDFIRSPDFYDLTPARQNYIRDVFVSLAAFKQNPGVAQGAPNHQVPINRSSQGQAGTFPGSGPSQQQAQMQMQQTAASMGADSAPLPSTALTGGL
jgi:hypothetical protein